MSPQTTLDDIALLLEAYDFAQFADVDLPVTVKSALYRLLDTLAFAPDKMAIAIDNVRNN